MIELRTVGKRIEAWRAGILLFISGDMAFAVSQAFVRDGQVKVDGAMLERPVKQKRWWLRRSLKERR